MPLRGNPDSTIATRTCPDEAGATAAASAAAPAGSASSAACSASSPGGARKARRVVVATRPDLALPLSAVALSFAVGSARGACAGYFGGWTDRIVTRVTDTIMAFPL